MLALYRGVEALSLRDLPFCGMEVDMAYALNTERLRALKPWNCPGSFALLEALAKSMSAQKLTSLVIPTTVLSHKKND